MWVRPEAEQRETPQEEESRPVAASSTSETLPTSIGSSESDALATFRRECMRLLANNQKLRKDVENVQKLNCSLELQNQHLHEANENQRAVSACLSELNAQLERHKTALESAIA